MSLDLGDLDKLDQVIRNAVRDEITQLVDGSEPVEIATRYAGGKIEIWPKDPSLGAKELPIDALFHKIIMVRDRLRVLEQQINGHAKLSDDEKVHLQQYITRCYGSLTTFNALFRHKDDHFSGTGSKDE